MTKDNGEADTGAAVEKGDDVAGLTRRNGRLFKPKDPGTPPLMHDDVNRLLEKLRTERGIIRDREPGE